MQTNDPQMARMQFGVVYFYAFLFGSVLLLLVLRPIVLDEFAKGILLTMLGYLGALVQQHSSYLFARQRPDGAEIPPGAAGKSTTTTETVIQSQGDSSAETKP